MMFLFFKTFLNLKKYFKKFYNIGMTFLNFNLCVPGFVISKIIKNNFYVIISPIKINISFKK